MSSTQAEQASRFDEFLRTFTVSVATSAEQRAIVHKIRYDVYCSRLGFEDVEAFPDGLEVDDFDDHALHFLVTHRATGRAAGCSRLVLADESRLTPTEALFHKCSPGPGLNLPGMRRHRLAEISRLAVDAPFSRDRRLDPAKMAKRRMLYTRDEKALFPLVNVALFLAAGAAGDLLRRTDCIALMEPSLHKLLRRTGIDLFPAGKTLMHRGARQPYFFDVEETVAAMSSGLRYGYLMIRAQLAGSLAPLSGFTVPAPAAVPVRASAPAPALWTGQAASRASLAQRGG